VFEALYTAAQSLLRGIGVDMDVQILDAAAATAANQRGDGHLAMTGVVTSDPSGIALLYHSRNYDGFAFSRWKDPAFDQLWDDAAVETDPAARLAMYEQIQRYILENALSIPTQQIVRFNFVHANVQGVRQDARGLYPWLYDVHIAG
jgi:peptide/nickel transport system substrate-binding protein